jgi:hypothetical protein
MNMKHEFSKALKLALSGVMLLLALGVSNSVLAQSGGGTVKFGYVLTDEEGSRAVNQKTYDLYEGLGVSLNDFSYFWASGLGLRADITNATLNNRNETVSLFKPGVFSLNLHHDRTQRIYSANANDVTRRETFRSSASISASRNAELFGGFSLTDRDGVVSDVFQSRSDTTSYNVDYQSTSFNIGGRAFSQRGEIRAEYRRSKFNDNALGSSSLSATDRTGDNFNVRAGVRRVGWDRLSLTSGYTYRRDKLDIGTQELVTKLGWAVARATLPNNLSATYKFTFGRTNNNSGQFAETDNVVNVLTLAKSWRGRYGLRLGYENRISDDLSERTTSNGLIVGGWLRDKEHFNASGEFFLRDRNVNNGATQTGDFTAYRQKVTLKYRDKGWGDISLRWNGKTTSRDPAISIRDTLTNPLVETRVNYNVISTTTNLKTKKYGGVSITYSYYAGKFQNNSAEYTYQFTDHVVRALLKPVTFDKLSLSLGGSYHRSRRDQDTERFDMEFEVAYLVTSDYSAGVKYTAQNFDDFLYTDQFYTGNIVELYLKKNIKL